MTETKTQSVRLTQTQFDKAATLAEQLYPHKPTRRFSEIVARLLRVAEVRDGKLVADEREVQHD
jgi:hypothetical protein